MKITKAEFITSAATKAQFITSDKPIIAVSGRSNVGKSSFINMLASRKKLARVSQQPGRTRLINYFDFGSFILADLPGYGFAKVSKQEKAKWAKMLDDFFAEKEKISRVFALCDIRHAPTADDRDMVAYLYYNLIPFTIIATKADKLPRSRVPAALDTIAGAFGCGKGDIIVTSAQTRQGYDNVLAAIERTISSFSEKIADGEEGDEEDDGEGDEEV